MHNGNPSNPPALLYGVVNTSVGLAYGLALPITVGVWTDMRWWIIVIITVLWLVSNGRIIDRWIPAITDTPIRFFYSAITKRSPANETKEIQK